MKKRGLIGDTLGIVLAVLGLIILIYVAVRVSGIFIDNNKLEQAKGTLSELEGAVINYDSLSQHTVLVFNPKDWYLFSVSTTEIFEIGKGPPCTRGFSCLCICKYKKKEKCTSKVVCTKFKGDINVEVEDDSFIEIDKVLSIKFVKDGEKSFTLSEE